MNNTQNSPREIKWQSPKNLLELKDILATKTSTDYFISGGTDILIAAKNGKEVNGYIDLTQIPELQIISQSENNIFIASGATHTKIENNPLIQKYLPALAKACSLVGSQQIRNRGTIGGSVANSSPAGDIIPVLNCLNSEVVLMNSKGIKTTLPIEEFILGINQTKLNNDEFILGFNLPISEKSISRFIKLGTRSQVTIPQITGTINLELDNNIIVKAKLVIGSISIKPLEISAVSEMFLNKNINSIGINELESASKAFSDYIMANTPKEFDRDYKAHAIKGVIMDLLELK